MCTRARHLPTEWPIRILVAICALTPLSAGRSLAQAIPGDPFGVASVDVPVGADAPVEFLETAGYALEERNGRALYPVFAPESILSAIGEQLAGESSLPRGQIPVLFLFPGTEPLELTVWTPQPQRITLVPRHQKPLAANRLFSKWWRGYHAAARQPSHLSDHPRLVSTYLTSMLTLRLGRPAPLLSRLEDPAAGVGQRTFELLAGAEKLRDATMRATMLRDGSTLQRADQPLPVDVLWTPRAPQSLAAAVDVEPIAMHVPEECFYLRFGSFDNYLWLSRLLREYSGDLARMVTLRGHDPRLNERIQHQLALRESSLAELLGSQVTADVAIIGRDTYMQEGATVGILLQARNNAALVADITRQRTTSLLAEKGHGATLETVQIGGRDVSFLTTPNHRLRSFYVADGDYHLVTTSRALVERFLTAGAGRDPLGASEEFRYARAAMPASRDDTVFAYFSSAFFRGLLTPLYQIELARRIEAVTDIELIQLARLAAANEGKPNRSIEDLVAGGFLPRGFGTRADGSRPVFDGSPRVLDSLRGARGSFLPVPDVPMSAASREEIAEYRARAAYYAEHWRQLDPLMARVKRTDLGKGRERLVVDARVAPLGEEKYGWALSLLGPASARRVRGATDDVVTLQAYLTGGLLAPLIPPHHLFVGVQDTPVDAGSSRRGILQVLRLLQLTPGYLGAWPKPGFLDRLPVALSGQPGPDGFSSLPLGLWRWQGDGFSVLSFQQETLARVHPQLIVEDVESPAQIRIHVGDLANSQLADWLRSLYFDRARQASLGNAKLLHALSQQLGTPRKAALETANELLDTHLVCTLGGQYQLVSEEGAVPYWRSTGTSTAASSPRSDFEAPLLQWFRGLDLEVTKTPDRLLLRADITMQRKPTSSPWSLPFLNLLDGKKKGEEPKSTDKRKPSG